MQEITKQEYLSAIRRLADGTNEYKLRGDCRNGKGDCVGLSIGALRDCGVHYKGLHSSNEFPRKYVTDLRYVANINDLRVGDTIWKAFEPGESGYNLPERYASDPDQRDYYHQGTVLSVTPLDIVHVSTRNNVGGAFHDTKLGKWRFAGQLIWLADTVEIEMETKMKAVVDSANDCGVNMRKKPVSTSTYLGRVPEGTVVEVLQKGDEWCLIQHGTASGYVMTQFLSFDFEGTVEADACPDNVVVTMTRTDAMRLYVAIGQALGVGGKLNDVG